MTRVAFIGSEAGAAAYRLAGLETYADEAMDPGVAFDEARRSADLVLVEASFAARIGAVHWRGALATPTPLVAVVPDMTGELPMPDLAVRLRRELGLVE